MDEVGDPELRAAFQIANSLHVNFCDNWQSPRDVQDSVGTIERFVSRLEPLQT